MLVFSRHVKTGSKLWVRAFSTTATSGVTSPSSFIAFSGNRQDKKCDVPRHLSYSTTSLTSLAAGAQVDEDLDTALDELLANPFDETTKPKIQKKKPVLVRDDDDDDGDNDDDDDVQSLATFPMKDAKPVPSTMSAKVSTTSFCVIPSSLTPTPPQSATN
jgi:hypothetical protein